MLLEADGGGVESYVVAAGAFESLVFRYHEVDLSSLDAHELIAAAERSGHPALLALVPLARGGSERAAIADVVDRVRRASGDPGLRADLLVSIAVFAATHGLRDFVRGIVRKEEMRDSPFYQEILDEGAALARAQDVVRVLKRRFPNIPDGTATTVLELRDLAELDRIFDLALEARSLEDFRAGLERPKV